MCGIVGFWEPPGRRSLEETRQRLEHMRECLEHRGPDDAGSWIDPTAGIALGHRRLSILDLSPAGHQPMASADGRYQMVYNGEVYNFRELREELSGRGHSFKGNSDTEVMLAAFSEWGPELSLSRFNGMFALAVWDTHRQQLLLARDRFGKKPLYYGRVGAGWGFASELKALRCLEDFSGSIDRNHLSLYLRFGYVPGPHSIYQGVYKLPAGSFLWLNEALSVQTLSPWVASESDLETSLRKAVERRMLADVPLGAFLSGGIDSSLVVALMQECSSQKVRTFSLGFREQGFDEAVYARRVAERLGTDHTEHYVTPEEARSVIPLLPTIYDEPFADSSQIPTYLVSKLARSKVTVVLTGDGGDEVFGGYNRYFWGPLIWRFLSLLPPGLRMQVSSWLKRVSVARLAGWLGSKMSSPQQKLTKVAELLGVEDARQLYKALASPWRDPDPVVIGGYEPLTRIDSEPVGPSIAEWMMRMDSHTYLPDDILVKVDRASMAVGLEARAPFLDPEVVAVAARMPLKQKIQGLRGKLPLRSLLQQRLPRELIERPKAGFAIPLGAWLRKELRDWAEDLLARIPEQGYLRAAPIQARWRQHQAHQRDWSTSLWAVLMFQAWLGQALPAAPGGAAATAADSSTASSSA